MAGLITSLTRVQLIEAIAKDPAAVVMVATDGIYSMRELPGLTVIGENGKDRKSLGDWEHVEHGNGIFIVQPGVYWFPHEGQTQKDRDKTYKTRGVSKGVIQDHAVEFEDAWSEYTSLWQREVAQFDRLPRSKAKFEDDPRFNLRSNAPSIPVGCLYLLGCAWDLCAMTGSGPAGDGWHLAPIRSTCSLPI
jgi:hypothetical protein